MILLLLKLSLTYKVFADHYIVHCVRINKRMQTVFGASCNVQILFLRMFIDESQRVNFDNYLFQIPLDHHSIYLLYAHVFDICRFGKWRLSTVR